MLISQILWDSLFSIYWQRDEGRTWKHLAQTLTRNFFLNQALQTRPVTHGRAGQAVQSFSIAPISFCLIDHPIHSLRPVCTLTKPRCRLHSDTRIPEANSWIQAAKDTGTQLQASVAYRNPKGKEASRRKPSRGTFLAEGCTSSVALLLGFVLPVCCSLSLFLRDAP